MFRWLGPIVMAIVLATTLIGGALAQEATPAVTPVEFPIVPGPTDCPLTAAPSVEAALAQIDATPIPASTGTQSEPEASPTRVAFTLPDGTPADDATTAEVSATVVQIVACINTYGQSAIFAFSSDKLIQTIMDEQPLTTDDVASLSTPQPLSAMDYGAVQSVEQVIVLPDGRVGAVVTTEFPANDPALEADWLVFTEVNGQWLVDEETDNISLETSATPAA